MTKESCSKNWLARGGAVSSQPERHFKMSKHDNIHKIKNMINIKYLYIFCAIFVARIKVGERANKEEKQKSKQK